MTENEIKEAKELLKECDELFYVNFSSEEEEILNGISRLLDELEQYRAIGTVEEIENSFKKTINAFEKANPLIKSALDILQEYQSIGTIDEFKALKEKNTPKKGIPYTSSNNHKFVECPSCHKDMDLYYDFCQHCGQSVDWGKTKT